MAQLRELVLPAETKDGFEPEYEVKYRYRSATHRIHVDNKAGVCRGVRSLVLDDEPLTDAKLSLTDDGRFHDVRVILG